jgi:hypothetical protein
MSVNQLEVQQAAAAFQGAASMWGTNPLRLSTQAPLDGTVHNLPGLVLAFPVVY